MNGIKGCGTHRHARIETVLSVDIVCYLQTSNGSLRTPLPSPVDSHRPRLPGLLHQNPLPETVLRPMLQRFLFGGGWFGFRFEGVQEEPDKEQELQPQRLWSQGRDPPAHESRVHQYVCLSFTSLFFFRLSLILVKFGFFDQFCRSIILSTFFLKIHGDCAEN